MVCKNCNFWFCNLEKKCDKIRSMFVKMMKNVKKSIATRDIHLDVSFLRTLEGVSLEQFCSYSHIPNIKEKKLKEEVETLKGICHPLKWEIKSYWIKFIQKLLNKLVNLLKQQKLIKSLTIHKEKCMIDLERIAWLISPKCRKSTSSVRRVKIDSSPKMSFFITLWI